MRRTPLMPSTQRNFSLVQGPAKIIGSTRLMLGGENGHEVSCGPATLRCCPPAPVIADWRRAGILSWSVRTRRDRCGISAGGRRTPRRWQGWPRFRSRQETRCGVSKALCSGFGEESAVTGLRPQRSVGGVVGSCSSGCFRKPLQVRIGEVSVLSCDHLAVYVGLWETGRCRVHVSAPIHICGRRCA